MFFSLCFLLTLVSYGFSGVQSRAAPDANDYADSYGARSLAAGLSDDHGHQRAERETRREMVNEGMDKVVSLRSALAEGTATVDKRKGGGVFLTAAKPEVETKEGQQLGGVKLKKAM